MSIISGKGIANLFIPPLIGVGMTVFKSTFFDGYFLNTMPMMVEIGASTIGFVISDIIGDMMLGFDKNDNGSFTKKIEALAVEPLIHGLIYGGLKETIMAKDIHKVGLTQGIVEGSILYVTTRFFSQPIIDQLA